jgi:hypothetical protein
MIERDALSLTLDHDGAQLHVGAALDALASIRETFAHIPADRAGTRLYGEWSLFACLALEGPLGALAASHLGTGAKPVRALLFDKNATTNWALGWHQDRTISVRQRHDVKGFGPWTVKQGLCHVAPPFTLISGMVTLRLHLDDVSDENAPLLIALKSHKYGLVPVDQINALVETSEVFACRAKAGDVWAYATGIVHASARAALPRRRRVLQVDYSRDELPPPLEWLGV